MKGSGTTVATDGENKVGATPAAGEEGAGVKILRTFRHNPDVENFYRFVHEHGLRREAKMLIEKILSQITKKKKKSTKH